jgi:hypothetical protein
MSRNSPERKESVTKREAKARAVDRATGHTRTKQADRSVKDALEDDEVREVLKLHHQARGA